MTSTQVSSCTPPAANPDAAPVVAHGFGVGSGGECTPRSPDAGPYLVTYLEPVASGLFRDRSIKCATWGQARLAMYCLVHAGFPNVGVSLASLHAPGQVSRDSSGVASPAQSVGHAS